MLERITLVSYCDQVRDRLLLHIHMPHISQTIYCPFSHACMFCLWTGQLISHSLIAFFPHIDDTFVFFLLMMEKQMKQVACLYEFHSLFVNMSILCMKWYEFINTFYCLFITKPIGHTKHFFKDDIFSEHKVEISSKKLHQKQLI